MSYYQVYGNVIVDSPGSLGGTLSITNSGNTAALNTQASIGFGVANISYNTLQNGLLYGNTDAAGVRISAVVDTVSPAVGTALVMNVSGNSLLPPAEAMRISSNGNVVVKGNLNVGFINGTAVTSLGGSSQWTTATGNIYYIGNVGIGIQTPQYALDVSNTGIRSTSILSSGIKTTTVVAVSNPTNVAAADFVIGEGTSSTATTVYGQNNIFVGNPSKTLTTAATYNVAVGNQAMTSLTTGLNNVALGYQAGNAITTGNYNTAIGANAYLTGSYNYSTAIGYNAQITGNNQICINGTATSLLPASISSSLTIAPVRNVAQQKTGDYPLYYNATTSEIYQNTSASSANPALLGPTTTPMFLAPTRPVLSQTAPVEICSVGYTIVSNYTYFSSIYLTKNMVINGIIINTYGSATGTALLTIWANNGNAPVATATISNTANIANGGVAASYQLASAYTVPSTGIYYIGISFSSASAGFNCMAAAGGNNANVLYGLNYSGTALPTTFASGIYGCRAASAAVYSSSITTSTAINTLSACSLIWAAVN